MSIEWGKDPKFICLDDFPIFGAGKNEFVVYVSWQRYKTRI
jgi:hypothetical protein